MKIRLVGARVVPSGRTIRQDELRVAFSNFANAPKNTTVPKDVSVKRNMNTSCQRQFRNAMRFSSVSENKCHFRSVISHQLR